MKLFHFGAVGLGAALLFILIWNIGPQALWHNFSRLGWGLVPFILIEGIAKIIHALGWRSCLAGPYKSLGFLRILGIDFVGHAMNYFTPTATIGGEVVRVTLLYNSHKSPEAFTAVIVGKITYVFAQILFVSLGSMFFFRKIPMPAAGYVLIFIVNFIILGGIIVFILIQKKGKLGALLRWLVSRRIGGKIVRKATDEITRVDEALKAFYNEHPGRFFSSVLWHILAMLFSILKTWYFLFLLAGGALSAAAGIWFLSTWMDMLTFAIPLDIGINEGIRVLVFKAMQFGAAQGLTFGIALRLDQIFWGALGLLIYAVYLPRIRQSIRSNPSLEYGVTENDPKENA